MNRSRARPFTLSAIHYNGIWAPAQKNVPIIDSTVTIPDLQGVSHGGLRFRRQTHVLHTKGVEHV
ncbi:MAG TPA: hypothetical protein VNI35_05520, partial [Nitrospira sp.]|nr:hypothetical protein [Nitrospira sp.]